MQDGRRRGLCLISQKKYGERNKTCDEKESEAVIAHALAWHWAKGVASPIMGATKDAYEFREGTCLKGYSKANSVNF